MRKKFIRIFFFVIAITIIPLSMAVIRANASSQGSAVVNGRSLTIDVVDPVKYDGQGATFLDVEGKVVIYTPLWHYNSTRRTDEVIEFVVVNEETNYKVMEINRDGNSYIPLNGFVLSVPITVPQAIQIGDVVTLKDIAVSIFTKAIESDEGARIVIMEDNVARGSHTIVYYNSLFGDRTGTDLFGSELVAEFDSETKRFVVQKVNYGGNNAIPENGFVISAKGNPYQFYLYEGVRFNTGDYLNFINFDFIELERTFTYPFNTINGTRLENYLNIYPYSSNPSGKTNTNQHGYEVAVNKDGIVVEMDTHVTIPEGGFALSGHGTSSHFLMNHVKIGMFVSYNVATKTVTFTDSLVLSTLYALNDLKRSAEEQIAFVKEGLYDANIDDAERKYQRVDSLMKQLETLKEQIEQHEETDELMSLLISFKQKSNEVEELLTGIYFDTLLSPRVSARGVWHRPFEKSLAQIQETLDALAEMNFTEVYLETFWNGYVIYPSEYVDYHPQVVGNFGEYGQDYLKAFIGEAMKRNIEVHAWVENFFVGVSWQSSSLWNDYPEWRIKNYNDTEIQTGKPGGEEEGFYFFDPANPEARQFIIQLYKELVENYELTGLQLDYIRYPSGNVHLETSSGYTEYAMNQFKERYGYKGDVKSLIASDSKAYGDWNKYRQWVITSFVEEVHQEIRPLNRELLLSIAVGPDANYAAQNLMQDWKTWVNNGWIDFVEPMVYVRSTEVVYNTVQKVAQISTGRSFQYTGLSPSYDGLPPIFNAYFVDASRQAGGHGSALFATHNILGKDEVISVLKSGTHRNKAISPHAPIDKVLAVAFDDLIHKADTIYIPNNKMTTTQKNQFEDRLKTILAMEMWNAKDYQAIYDALEVLRLELTLYVDGVARERMMEDIEYLLQIIDLKITRYLINYGFWNPTQNPERPDVNSFDYPRKPEPTPNDEKPKSNYGPLLVGAGVAGVVILVAGGTVILWRRRSA